MSLVRDDPSAIEDPGDHHRRAARGVWPWLVQMGYGRAGWYSYDQLDMGGESATGSCPSDEAIEVGDVMPTAPEAGSWSASSSRGRALVLYTDTAHRRAEAGHRGESRAEQMPAGLAASGASWRPDAEDFAASWAFVARAARRRPDPADRAFPRRGSAQPGQRSA